MGRWHDAGGHPSFADVFRNDAQVNAVCRVLLEQLYVKGLWTDDGPTETAFSHLEQDGGPLSRGERVLLLAAFAIWNGNEKLPFGDIFHLDDDRLAALASLLMAFSRGSTAIDAWLLERDGRQTVRALRPTSSR